MKDESRPDRTVFGKWGGIHGWLSWGHKAVEGEKGSRMCRNKRRCEEPRLEPAAQQRLPPCLRPLAFASGLPARDEICSNERAMRQQHTTRAAQVAHAGASPRPDPGCMPTGHRGSDRPTNAGESLPNNNTSNIATANCC